MQNWELQKQKNQKKPPFYSNILGRSEKGKQTFFRPYETLLQFWKL